MNQPILSKRFGVLLTLGCFCFINSWASTESHRDRKSVIVLNFTPPKVPLPASGQPFVTLFADEFFRGDYYHHFLKRECTNLPSQYNNWASSINPYDRCVFLCDKKDCGGQCRRLHGSYLDRLDPMGLNDKVSSIKFCYTFAERGK